MARHRSAAPEAPDPHPSGATPAGARPLADAFGDLPPSGPLPAPASDAAFPAVPAPAPPPSPAFGLPALGTPVAAAAGARALGADRAPGTVPAPWTGPVPRTSAPVDPDPTWTPSVPAPRGGPEGRHAWVTPEAHTGPAVPAAPDAPGAFAAPPGSPLAAGARATSVALPRPVAPAPVVPEPVTPAPRTSGETRAARRRSTGRTAPATTGGRDPETTPLDLAAIALASARTTTGSHRISGTGGLPVSAGPGSGPLTTTGPATGGRRLAAPSRGLSPTRTAGTLAVAGAIVSAGLAAFSSGSMLANAEGSASAEQVTTSTLPAASDSGDTEGR